MTKTESRTPRGTLSGDLGRNLLTGGAPSELPHVRNEVKGSRHPTEQSHTNSSAPSHKTLLSSQPQSVILPRSLDKSNSRTQGSEEAGRGAKRAAEGPTSDKERKEKKVSKEPESHQEDPATDTSRAQLHKPEPTSPSRYVTDIKPSPLPSPQSSVGRTYSSSLGRRNDLDVPPPRPATTEFGGNFGLSSNSLPLSGITQASFTPPVSLPPLTQPKHGIATSPNNNPTSSSADPHSQLPTMASDSAIRAAPSLSRATSPSASAAIAPKTSREVRKEEETPPRPIPPPKSSQSAGQPSSATVPLESQKRPTASLRDTGDDTLWRLPDDRHHGETPTSSLVQVDSSQEVVENTPRAKSSLVQSSGTPSFVSLIDFDAYSLYNLTARTAPPMAKVSSNMKEKRGTQAQSGQTISQLHHSLGENGGMVPPNDQDHLDPLTGQTEMPSSGQPTATGVHVSIDVPLGMAVVVAPIAQGDPPIFADNIKRPAPGVNQEGFQHGHGPKPEPASPPPPYEQGKMPSATPVVQEGSRPQAGFPTEASDAPKKLPGNKYPIFSSPP